MTDALLTDTLWRMMLRFIGRRPLQTILFVSGVALGVAMMVAIDLANSSAARAFDLFTESVTGRTTHQITGGPGGVPQELYRQLRVEMGIRNTAPTVSAYVQALELDNQPLRVFGIDAFAEAPFRGYVNVGAQQNDTTVGDITRFFTDPNTALMAEELAARYGIEAGDTITVRYGTQRHTVTVVGLLRPTDAVTQEGLQELLITDVSTAQELLGMVGTLTTIDVIIPEGDTATLQRIRSVLPEGVIIQEAGARTGAVSQMTDAFELSLTALSLLALVVGMFLIYNTVTFSVVQRRPVIGTLRALGVTRQQVFGMILWEAALLSAIGAAIGLALGIVMGRGAVVLVTQTVSSLYFTLNVRGVDVSVESLIRGALIGVGAALLAAVIPALEATTTPPTGALKRSDIESKVRRAIPALTAFGAMLLIGAVILFAGRELVFNFTGLFAIVVGFALFTPLLALLLMSLLRPILGRILGILGLIAPRSIVRSLSRTSVAVAALMVAVSVIVGVSAMVGSFRNNVQDWLSNTAQADIYITPPMITANRQDVPVDPSVQDEVGATAGVARTAMARHIDVIRKDDPLPVYLTAVDYDISEGQRRFVWSIGDFDTTWNALVNGGVILSETFARARNIPIGDGQTVTLITDNGERTYPVIGVMYDYSGTQGTLMMFEDVYRRDFNDEAISSIAAFVEPGADVDAIIAELQGKFAGRYELVIQSTQGLRNGVLVIFDQTFAITTALNLLATVVAFIGILSALASLQLERTRELGTMRANGMTRRQLFRLTLLETGLMGFTAGLMAMPVGTVLAWVLVYIINVRSFGWSLQLQLRPEFYAQAFAVALVAALLAGIYPALRIGRIQPAMALRSE